jgi:GNAT superfamily N-acetyltransferase
LRPADVTQAVGLSVAAGWNQTEQDWGVLLALEPEGCLCVECEGVVAASTTAICYETELAWIGMVLTAPEFRGRGFARLLMNRTMDFLTGRGVACIKLDATDMGAPLYRKLGFVDECPVERWTRQPGSPASAAPFQSGFDSVLDLEVFGADRRLLLDRLAGIGATSSQKDGFAMARPGRNAAYFGPCVATSAGAAKGLVKWFLAKHGAQLAYWDLLPENTEAVRLATEFGFACARRLRRMTFRSDGNVERADCSNVFAIAGFEYG